MSGEWTDQIAGARMQVDQRFQERVLNSEFTNQQWGLIMSAVEFEIRNPELPGDAELVANTDKVEQILPEIEDIPQGVGGPAQRSPSKSGGDGLLGSLRNLLAGGDDEVDQEQLAAATTLVEEYVDELQQFLQEEGEWESLCNRVSRGSQY